MFEQALSDKFRRIFLVEKVTYDLPSDVEEQECLFVEVESCRSSIKDSRALARVTGSAFIFGNTEKLPYGFFAKKIKEAELDDVRNIFFFEIEDNGNRYRNIARRAFSFIYFFDSEYDPDQGELTAIEMEFQL